MMKWIMFVIGFIAGGSFGVMMMSVMIAGSEADRRREVLFDAGGSGEQGGEPGDKHDETDSEDCSLSCSGLPETSEEQIGGDA